MSKRNSQIRASWLSVHPGRTKEWLDRMIEDGFNLHHADGNPTNDSPRNLILIEGIDHMLLHGQVVGMATSMAKLSRDSLMRNTTAEQRSARARMGGKARWQNTSELQRQQAARKAAVARWAKRNAHRDILIVED